MRDKFLMKIAQAISVPDRAEILISPEDFMQWKEIKAEKHAIGGI